MTKYKHPIITIPANHKHIVYKCIECGAELPDRFMPGSSYIRWFCDPCLIEGMDSQERMRD